MEFHGIVVKPLACRIRLVMHLLESAARLNDSMRSERWATGPRQHGF